MASDKELRIGDTERTAAAEELGEHYAQGRLSAEEHQERLDRAMGARTASELTPLFADLPGKHYRAPARRTRQPTAPASAATAARASARTPARRSAGRRSAARR